MKKAQFIFEFKIFDWNLIAWEKFIEIFIAIPQNFIIYEKGTKIYIQHILIDLSFRGRNYVAWWLSSHWTETAGWFPEAVIRSLVQHTEGLGTALYITQDGYNFQLLLVIINDDHDWLIDWCLLTSLSSVRRLRKFWIKLDTILLSCYKMLNNICGVFS